MDPLFSEVVKQVPAVGVGLFVFLAYQKLVVKLQDIIEKSTAATVASTAALTALKDTMDAAMRRAEERHAQLMTAIDAVPAKVPHEWATQEQARLTREALGRR